MHNRNEEGKWTSFDWMICLLSSERAALGQARLTTGWLAENGRATSADDYCLCVRENGGDCEAAGALDIHEEGSRSRNKVL
jgi:hypothetical protein